MSTSLGLSCYDAAYVGSFLVRSCCLKGMSEVKSELAFWLSFPRSILKMCCTSALTATVQELAPKELREDRSFLLRAARISPQVLAAACPCVAAWLLPHA